MMGFGQQGVLVQRRAVLRAACDRYGSAGPRVVGFGGWIGGVGKTTAAAAAAQLYSDMLAAPVDALDANLDKALLRQRVLGGVGRGRLLEFIADLDRIHTPMDPGRLSGFGGAGCICWPSSRRQGSRTLIGTFHRGDQHPRREAEDHPAAPARHRRVRRRSGPGRPGPVRPRRRRGGTHEPAGSQTCDSTVVRRHGRAHQRGVHPAPPRRAKHPDPDPGLRLGWQHTAVCRGERRGAFVAAGGTAYRG